MKKSLGFIWIVVLMFGVKAEGRAQEGGIGFEHGSWQEVRDKARLEKKLIFADFYTEWCGPCLAMADEVFSQPEVGHFYNTHFVNVKVDAEKGEGVRLKEKYKVVSYPTFLFIDPHTEEVIHRSSSRQEKATFLFTGKSAITPVLRSAYLEKDYLLGNRSRGLLGNYMDYLASIYQREKVAALLTEYVALPDFSLKNKADWEVFVKHIGGVDHPQFQEVLNDKGLYAALFGQSVVDAKLFQEFNTTLDIEALGKAPDFRGKDFLLKKNAAERYLRDRNYQAALPLLDQLMAAPGEFKDELCHYLKFTARSVLYGEYPDFWVGKCAGYAQYVAYNSNDRQDAGIHYDYALILEKLIRTVPDAGKYFPASIVEKPEYGAKDYSLRSARLKQKPVKAGKAKS